ncbi:tumor necrosis factor receptor superfamily member 10A-like [Podarcis lilfordi]|uniref:Tumor necrosis factor receptor superfamily member 10A-like n=1 Tax=Podarcis lilfordi TaxID=74358 RepID=A0AA35NTN3_9SAUR|nr:tumor necrosis factor receptor superfamily member 10A-like [Podarcis lilfordi]
MVKSCTVKSNTECRCKAGYYCPPSCEECAPCKRTCPKGESPVENCSATTDMKCGSPTETKNATSTNAIAIVVVACCCIIVFGAIALFCWKSKRNGFCQSDEETSAQPWWLLINQMEKAGPLSENKLPGNTDRSDLAAGSTNEEPLLGSTESTTASLQPNLQGSRQQPVVVVVAAAENSDSVKVLDEIYLNSRKEVPLRYWKNLMRKSGLEDNDIEEIVHDYPSLTDEQHYQMLKTLQNRYGTNDALLKLLNGIWAMKLIHIYENLTNELKSKGIITLETED